MSDEAVNPDERGPLDPPDPPDDRDDDRLSEDPQGPAASADLPGEETPKKRNSGKTGATSQAGRARSAKNAIRHGCCAWTLVLSTESEETWLAVLAQWRASYAPPGAQIAHLPPKIENKTPNEDSPETPTPACSCAPCVFETTTTYSMIAKVAQMEWHRIRNESNYNACLSTTCGAMPYNWTPEQIKTHDLHLRYKTTAERAFQRDFRLLLAHLKAQKDKLAETPTPTPAQPTQPEPEPEVTPRTIIVTQNSSSPTGYVALVECPPREGVVYPCPTPPPPNPHSGPGSPPKPDSPPPPTEDSETG